MLRFILLVLILSFASGKVKAQLLFESDDLLHLKIKMDVKTMIGDREVRDEHEAILYYNDGDSLNIKLSVRGKTRANPKICSFPPIKVNFKKKQVKGTLFDGQNKLKLVTHCNDRTINEEYILREYMVYKLHQLTTPYSFKVRLCRITYIDTNGKFEDKEHYGFLIEDIDDLAARFDMEEFDRILLNQDAFYRSELDKLVLFQYMIGNLDWSVPRQHNFKLIYGNEIQAPVAIPYDFDYCGMVYTNYAKPPPDINVSSVRMRNFRGFCRAPGTYEAVAREFIELKPAFYELYTSSEYLSEKSIDLSVKYLDSFFEILADEKEFNKKIVTACRFKHDHLFE
jgi:hypothetical protein